MNETATPTSSPNAGRPKSCRGRGRTVLFGALFLGVAAVLTAGALQAFGFGPFRHGACGSMDPAQVEKKIDRIAGWIVEDLGGTPEQQAKLAAIAKAAAKDLAPIHDELVAGPPAGRGDPDGGADRPGGPRGAPRPADAARRPRSPSG